MEPECDPATLAATDGRAPQRAPSRLRRLIIENLLKYGLLYNPVAFLKAAVPPAGNLPLLACWLLLPLFAAAALAIEQLGALRLSLEKRVHFPRCACVCALSLGVHSSSGWQPALAGSLLWFCTRSGTHSTMP